MLRSVVVFAILLIAAHASAQSVVEVGRGSYAAEPPKGKVIDGQRKVDLVQETEERRLYLVHDDGRPIPSNKWYQNLIFQQFGTGLWAMPHKVDATPEGIEFFFPTRADNGGTHFPAEFPLVITGDNFKPSDSRAKSWSDYLVSFRMPENDERRMDVTLGQGIPYVWLEFTGIKPRIAFGGHGGKGSRGKNAPVFFNLANKQVAFPLKADALGIEYEGHSYAVFAPDNTVFVSDEKGLQVEFGGQQTFLVLSPLPKREDIALLHQHAFSVPRASEVTWDYDRTKGAISTTWITKVETWKGNESRLLQGWLPHHWRENTAPLEFVGLDYPTIRGRLRCTLGNQTTISYPFHGVLPNLPAPTAESGVQPERIKQYLSEHFASDKKPFAADTYWGGKDLERFAQAAFIATQTKDPSAEFITKKLRRELENWLTYTPGEKERYFAYYPRRKGLIGFNVAYGSEHFTDNHFHNGYFVFSAGLLSQLQPDFAEQYGDMARLLAKTYANYDRQDKRFPFFRTFDLWRGHSFADGNGFPEGNNQESTGEAINSWVGMILLGEALGDKELTAAGVMGYAFESRANVEYWFDPHDDVFPAAYPHNACGMIWCNSIVWGTWFTADPAWIYGIQWIPSGPYYAFYDHDPGFIKKTYADVVREMTAFQEKEAARNPNHKKKPADIKSQGGELGSYHLGFVMHADAAWVIDHINKLYQEPGDTVAHDQWMANIYYQAHALKELGRVDWKCHGDSPTSMVYFNASTKQRTFVAWNPTPKAQVVRFYENDKLLGTLEAPPLGTTSSSKLAP